MNSKSSDDSECAFDMIAGLSTTQAHVRHFEVAQKDANIVDI